jgi:TonB-linked SusC/RagA family outer membrane protein
MYKKITELFFRRDHYAYSNFILKMKLTILLMIIGFMQIKAEGYGQLVSLNVKKANLIEIIADLREQSNVDFLYNTITVKDFKPVTINLNNKDITTILDACFNGQPFTYKLTNKVVLITNKVAVTQPQPQPVPAVVLQALQKVTGVVRDSATNESMRAVSITIEGTGQGTVTDNNGRYSIDVPGPNAVLVYSFVGYTSKRAFVGNTPTINISLASTQNKLNDVVVIGYGTRTKGAVTGAISTVKAEVFENRPQNNVYDALQGALPGVTITRASGAPGNQGYTLQVRGYSSINGNQPFVLIDGIPGDINTINPSDIAQISVLKDAAAAIYGNRAADGVILVTTKKGQKGPPVIEYTANVGLKTPDYLKKMMNTLQYAEFQSEGLINAGIAGFPQSVFDDIKNNAAPNLAQGWNYGITQYPGFYGTTDWNKAIYKNSTQQNHTIGVSGGGDGNNYLLSAGYDRDNGSLRYGESYSDRYNLRLNYDFRPSKRLNVQTRTTFDNAITHQPTMIQNALTNVVRQSMAIRVMKTRPNRLLKVDRANMNYQG